MKIFLSAASDQFREVRNALRSDLSAAGAEVVVQEDFQQHPSSLLQKLEDSIAGCDRVIAIVGTAFGFEPPEPARPPGRPRRSYSQWEYHFALGERLDGTRAAPKPLSVYLADADYLAAHPHSPKQTPDQTRLQEELIAEVHASGKDRDKFHSLDHLRGLVLRNTFRVRDPDRKPRNLPFASLGTLFKGRGPFLDDLRRRLTGEGGGPVAIVARQAIHGLGGIGKTRAALEYAWKYDDHYSALLFVSAPDRASLRTNLANLVGVLAVESGPSATSTEEQRLAEVLAWLRDHPRWLLILDNVDTPEAAREAHSLLAKLSGGDLLITSRISNWPAGVEPLELHVLLEADAAAFLLERTPHRRPRPDDPALAAAIARDLDRLALALEQAGAFIDTRRLSFAEYREAWASNRSKVLAWHDPNVMTYEFSVAVTWVTSFDRLGDPARRLLQVLAWMAPEPIPLGLFEADRLKAAIAEPREALADLARYSLTRFNSEGDSVEVHRLVQEIARSRAAESERADGLRVALETLDELVPQETDEFRPRDLWLPLAAHADAVVWEADRARIEGPTASLMWRHATFLQARGSFTTAETVFRRVLELGEATYGPDHPEVATLLNGLGVLLRGMGRMAEAEPLLLRALEIDEARLGPNLADYPAIAMRLNSLAGLYWLTGRMAEAEPLYRRALEIDEAARGPDDPNVSTVLNNLALVLKDTGRVAEAEPLMRRSLAIDEARIGPDSPDVAMVLSSLGSLLQETGRMAEAEPLMRRSLAIMEAFHGPDHPHVAVRLNNLAAFLWAAGQLAETQAEAEGRLAEAEPLMLRALEIDEASLGPAHPLVAVRLNNLAELLRATDRVAEAEPLYRRALIVLIQFQRQTGHEHPNFPVGLSNYENYLERRGFTKEQILERGETLIREADGDGP